MASDISSGGSSKFLAARKLFRANSSNTKEEVEVFVEDGVDSVFWRHFFAKHGSDKIFKIRVLRCIDNELCGKDALIKYVKLESLGRNKLIAIDSDYDYIIDNYHSYSNDIRECKYVIHTLDAYSIENYKIVSSILKESIYLTSFCDQIREDIDKMILEASQVLYNLFTIHLFSVYKKDNVYKQSDYKADLNKLTFKNDKISEGSKVYISSRIEFFKNYLDKNPEYVDFLTLVESKGVYDYNCIQFMNGHDVLDEVGVKIAAGISAKYRGEYLNWLYANVDDEERKKNLLNKFNNSTRVSDSIHQLKDRIREILYDISPDFTWEPSIKIDNHIKGVFQ